MSQRKFNAGRLYKLFKIIVISASLIAGVIFIYGFYQLETGSVERFGSASCDKVYPYINPVKDSIDEAINNANIRCNADVIQQSYESESFTFGALGFAILLPLIFFGGAWLYKFIYPVQSEKN